jgi:hypothetical protein
MKIKREKVNGRQATVAYMDDGYIKILFDDGEMIILFDKEKSNEKTS